MTIQIFPSILCLGLSFSSSAQTIVFSYTDSVQTYSVPDDVCYIEFDVQGAEGSPDGGSLGVPGKGGRITGIMPVIPGQTLLIHVGGMGTSPSGGFNGGGGGGSAAGASGPDGGAGGGASDIRIDTHRTVVAGGGGGCGGYTGVTGGNGGEVTGQNGTDGAAFGGAGGTQLNGGNGGSGAGDCGTAGTSGIWAHGGRGGDATCGSGFGAGGGGGGGYYGGGGGGGAAYLFCCPDWAGGGGGGSNYADSSATNVIHTQGYKSGNGEISITNIFCTSSNAASEKLGVDVQPNPFHERIIVSIREPVYPEWTLLNSLGKKLDSRTITTATTEINSVDLAPGVYFLRLKFSDSVITKKLVKN